MGALNQSERPSGIVTVAILLLAAAAAAAAATAARQFIKKILKSLNYVKYPQKVLFD